MTEKIQIYVWPDGTWCYQHNLLEYAYKSDDYINLTVDNNESTIEEAVTAYVSI